MAYTINKSDGTELSVLQDATVDTSTSITLVGKNYIGYGEIQNENFLFLLENFANNAAPRTPIKGQIWFDTTTNQAKIYDGTRWVEAGTAAVSDDAPLNSPLGALWFKTPYKTLYVWTGTEWQLIGPQVAEGFGRTEAVSDSIFATNDVEYPIIKVFVNDLIIGIIASNTFTIRSDNPIVGFSNIRAGYNINSNNNFAGDLIGNATTADRLSNIRLINGTGFDGSSDITITSTTTNALVSGPYIVGSNFDGSNPTTWTVDATSSNTIGKIVVRDSGGDFAAGTITANLVGDVTGNVTAVSGTSAFDTVTANQFIGAQLTGNSSTTTRLVTPRDINGVAFDGTADITVPADAFTLTGTAIANSVVSSNLETVGTLVDLDVATKIEINNKIAINATADPIISATAELTLQVQDPGDNFSLKLISNDTAVTDGIGPLGGLVPVTDLDGDLGKSTLRFKNAYAETFTGNLTGTATNATASVTADNIAGGTAGGIPYQSGAGTTVITAAGVPGQTIISNGTGAPYWGSPSFQPLTFGAYLDGNGRTEYPGAYAVTLDVDADTANTANKVVARDGSGNFSAGTITASLNGNASTASTATALSGSRTINGTVFDNTGNITITAEDPNSVDRAGDTMSGFLSLHADPTANLHAATKRYVDNVAQSYTFVYKDQQTVGSFTNQVGSFNNSHNFFDVYPPSGKTMSNLTAFIASIGRIHYAGGVDGNDSIRCEWDIRSDRIRVWVQGTEQRAKPKGNYLAIWS